MQGSLWWQTWKPLTGEQQSMAPGAPDDSSAVRQHCCLQQSLPAPLWLQEREAGPLKDPVDAGMDKHRASGKHLVQWAYDSVAVEPCTGGSWPNLKRCPSCGLPWLCTWMISLGLRSASIQQARQQHSRHMCQHCTTPTVTSLQQQQKQQQLMHCQFSQACTHVVSRMHCKHSLVVHTVG